MKKKFLKNCLSFISIGSTYILLGTGAIAGLYLKGLPYAVSNPHVINYIENTVEKSVGVKVRINNPQIKTAISPIIRFNIDNVVADYKNEKLLQLNNFDIELSLKDILRKKISLNSLNTNYIFVDVNKILEIPVLNSPQKDNDKPSDWEFDVFKSSISLNEARILYDIDKKTTSDIVLKNILLDDNPKKKQLKLNVIADISKDKENLHIITSDNNGVFIENGEKITIKNSDIFINNALVNVCGEVDNKYNYKLNLNSKNFAIKDVLSLLNTQIIENNIADLLIYFRDIDGNFNFNVDVDNNKMNGRVDLNKLTLKIEPLMNLPILLTSGNVTFDEKNLKLKDFKGYYNNKKSNPLKFDGTVNDYIKSVDTDIVGDAVVTDDFAKNYLSKLLGYPMRMHGIADTKLVLKSKFDKIDMLWLYRFKKGNGFVIDGEESYMNNAANRVLAAKMHFKGTLLNLESLNYYAGNPEDDNADKRIPILSMNGNIDFANGQTFVKDFGLDLPKPMPSGFINMLIKQRLFKNGTFTGHMRVINTGKYPVLQGDLKAEKIAIPSQRLFIKSGEFKTDEEHMHINANGRYRRSKYDIAGTIMNEIKFPIVVKNITLSVDKIDIEKYMQALNQQQSTQAATDVNQAISEAVEKGGDDENSDSAPTFDLANLIIEECILKVQEGFYKQINFANVIANMSLDKNSLLKISSNRFDIAEGHSSTKIECDLKNHLYNIKLGIKDVNSDVIATSLLNLSKEISGKASGFINLNTDDSLKLNGHIKFRILNGAIEKIGLVEYIMKVAALFRNPFTMMSPSTFSSLVNVPKGDFNEINGDIILKDNLVYPMKIKSKAPLLSSYIIGTYNLENQDASLRIYTKFSNKRNGFYGFVRNLSLNSLANRIPLNSRNDSSYYASEIAELPEIEAPERDCQIFLTKVDGDIEHNNFLSSLKRLK